LALTKSNSRTLVVLAFFTFLSWLGMMLHNAQELPQLTLLSPEEFYPTLIYVVLLLGSIFLPWRRTIILLLLGLALMRLIAAPSETILCIFP
jgi:hypothetical protein